MKYILKPKSTFNGLIDISLLPLKMGTIGQRSKQKPWPKDW